MHPQKPTHHNNKSRIHIILDMKQIAIVQTWFFILSHSITTMNPEVRDSCHASHTYAGQL
jgi:hypothetical protein